MIWLLFEVSALPVTATLLRLHHSPSDVREPLAALAELAAADPTARPVPAGSAVAVRTHEVRDISEDFSAVVNDAPIEAAAQAQLARESACLPLLRARYLLASDDASSWHIVVFSAVLGTRDAPLLEIYLELFDAFVGGLRWDQKP